MHQCTGPTYTTCTIASQKEEIILFRRPVPVTFPLYDTNEWNRKNYDFHIETFFMGLYCQQAMRMNLSSYLIHSAFCLFQSMQPDGRTRIQRLHKVVQVKSCLKYDRLPTTLHDKYALQQMEKL
ncbi:predicted protein [Chaetoceros tenuissimus]|uniref:Uncharacterized protein n=1 Tax=Chaetoceros tenuissimus TaxID=426638 RepID=A0AAD3GZK2_9STRA|nr:predicted protein [Chaetoceros tenuissimus]